MAVLAVLAGGFLAVEPAQVIGGAVIDSADCMQNELRANDDSYSSQVQLPFGVDFYGTSFESLWVNNNGNVTFDGPLNTFTPFGLADTRAKIIAPFFADVDTRGVCSETVRYGWGTTTYEGQRAFCVNWVDVGYYSASTDKLNSFQLLLVNREDASSPGAFDIIFNYDRVQWETGSASGGTGGLGGTSAVAGFSNGSGRDGTSCELFGSSVNGAFVDTSPTGLANTSTDSSVTGRHVFRVRGGSARLTQYVALGDSFQSGEGAGAYLPNTDIPGNRCHRSAYAYPKRLVDAGVVNLNLDFGACSNAVIDDLSVGYDPNRPPYTDGIAQLDRLSSSTKLVTLGIGGNDMGFANVLKGCVTAQLGDALNPFVDAACEPEYGDSVDDRLEVMIDKDKLGTIYKEVRRGAPFARVLILGYPRFYVEGGQHNAAHDDYCAGMRMTDQRWINREIRQFNSAISNSARSLGLQYVGIYDTPAGHELCGPSTDLFLNGIKLFDQVESYHPNEFGHELIARDVTAAPRAPSPGTLFNVHPGETIDYPLQSSGGDRDASTQWPEVFVSADQLVEVPEYEFSGFRSPVNAAPAFNQMKAGRAVPLKFALGGDFGMDILSAGSPSSTATECATGVAISNVETTTTAGNSSLSYDAASGTYTYVWKTASTWAGTCRTFTLTLDDGSSDVTKFKFK